MISPFVPAGWTGRTAYPSDDQSRWSHDGWTVGAQPARHRRCGAKSESRTVARGARPAARRRIAELPESTRGRFRARGPRRSGVAPHPAPTLLRPRRPSGVRGTAARPTGIRGHPRGLRCRVDRVTSSMGPLSPGTCACALWSHSSCERSASNRVVKRDGVCGSLHGRGCGPSTTTLPGQAGHRRGCYRPTSWSADCRCSATSLLALPSGSREPGASGCIGWR